MSDQSPPRLREGGDALAKLLDAAAREQGRPAPGARERVFRGLSRPMPRRWPLVFAAGLAAAAAALLVLPRRPAPLILRESAGAVSMGPLFQTGREGAALERDGLRIALGPDSGLQQQPLQLVRGDAAFLVSGAFAMQAGAVRIEAAEALFVARVRERAVVYVRRGTVRIGGVQLREGDRWPSDAPPPDALATALAELARDPSRGVRSLAQLEEPRQTPALQQQGLESRARDEERAGRFAQAAAIYAQLAQGEDPWAGNALYDLARVRLRHLDQPAQALQSLLEYRRRFPAGPLQQEVALTSIEARLALGQEDGALGDIDDFLARYSQSERASEVRALRASLLRHRLPEPP